MEKFNEHAGAPHELELYIWGEQAIKMWLEAGIYCHYFPKLTCKFFFDGFVVHWQIKWIEIKANSVNGKENQMNLLIKCATSP